MFCIGYGCAGLWWVAYCRRWYVVVVGVLSLAVVVVVGRWDGFNALVTG